MKIIKHLFPLLIAIHVFSMASAQKAYNEEYRPQIHFSPKAHWTNDPNGMVYYNGTYHLFFQYYPEGSVWGPMHWGHTISTDLIHWKEQPIALYPDSLGYIFSGSAVVDKDNTSGFGKNGQIPLVAIFTHHSVTGEKAGRSDFQNQSIAYSLDNGKTWTKYEGNPVLKNPGITDFRDPKVMWYEPQKKWVMTLATKDHITFYSSPDLKSWTKESEFGKELGAHGGVWECPDLFSINDGEKKLWVLIISLNPGAPNKGSGTQYFIGDFDGKTFTPSHKNEHWIDYGPDDYAGITWSNTHDRKIFIGWMSNWLYANLVPTEKWRNAMTLPRELKVKHVGDSTYIASEPVAELNTIASKTTSFNDLHLTKSLDLSTGVKAINFPCRINLSLEKPSDFSLVLSNDGGEKVIIGYDKQKDQYYIDRSNLSNTNFYPGFTARHIAPRLANADSLNVSVIIDRSSVELFADDGLSVMTELFFPTIPFTKINVQSTETITIKKLEYTPFKSIWP